MQMRIIKIAGVTVFGGAMLLAGAFLVNMVGAQTSQTPDCNAQSSSFWGYIACWIGSPSQGISGADTLFKGQKAIYDKVGTGGTGGSAQFIKKAQTKDGTPTAVDCGAGYKIVQCGRSCHPSAIFARRAAVLSYQGNSDGQTHNDCAFSAYGEQTYTEDKCGGIGNNSDIIVLCAKDAQ